MSVFSKSHLEELKKNLRLGINRLQLLKKKKTEMAMKARTEIADYIAANKPDRARTRVEHIIREEYVVEALEILEMYCDLLLARFGLIEQMKTLDDGIAEAVVNILWAAPRIHFDIAEFKTISDQLTMKYGKPFAEAARANQLEFPARVNPKVISKLLSAAPPNLLVERYMIEIAAAAGVPFVPDPDVMREGAQITSNVAPSVKQDGAKITLFLPEGKHVTQIDGSSLTEEWRTSEFFDYVTALESSGNDLFVATGTGIHLLLGGVVSSSIKVRKPVKILLLAGSRIVVTDDTSKVTVISIDSRSTLKLEHQWSGEAGFVITAACQPRSYINKIVFGSANGRMRVFELDTGKSVQEFDECSNSGIRLIKQSTCIDTVAVDCENGTVMLWELNEKKMRCLMAHEAAISSIAFRPDQKTKMLVGEVTGKVSIWNFYKEHLLSTCKAHSDAIDMLFFHKGNSFLSMSSGSIKVWKVVVNGEPKLLKERQPAAIATDIEQTEEVEMEMVWDEKTSIDALSETPRVASLPSWKCDWLVDSQASISNFNPQAASTPKSSERSTISNIVRASICLHAPPYC